MNRFRLGTPFAGTADLLLWLSFVLLALGLSVASAQEKTSAKTIKAVRFGKLWDAKGKLWTNATVIFEGDRIKTVTSEASAIAPGAEVIDLSKYKACRGSLTCTRT